MRLTVVFTIILLLLTASCREEQLPEVTQVDLPPEELNTKIALDAPSGWNDFKFENAITLTIKNVSEDDLVFDKHYGARIFVYENNGEWKEVEDQLISLRSNDIVLKPVRTNPTDMGTRSILPRLNLENERQTLRIYIIGYIYKDHLKTNMRTGAYIDIHLTP